MNVGRFRLRFAIAVVLLGFCLTAFVSSVFQRQVSGQQEIIVLVAELNGSGVSGDATLTDNDDGTVTVDVLLTGGTGSHPMHIHKGSCESPGDIVIPLADTDSNGGSVTAIAGSFSDLSAMGPLAIVVHGSAGEMDNYIACGNVGDALRADEARPTGVAHSEELLYEAKSGEDFIEWQADSWIHDGDLLSTQASATAGAETYVLAPFDASDLDAFALEAEIRIPGAVFPADDCPAYFGFIVALVDPAEGVFAGIDNVGDSEATCPTRYAAWTPWIAFKAPLEEIASLDGALPPDNNWHTYRLEIAGDRLALLVDGEEVFTSTDERYAIPGSVGIVSGNLALEMRSFSIFRLSSTDGDEPRATPEPQADEGSPEPTIAAIIGEPVVLENVGDPWLTYENVSLGLSFQYPSDWQLVEEPSGLGVRLFPPGLNAEDPVPFIAIAYDPDTPYDATIDVITGMSPLERVMIGGIAGRRYQDTELAVPYQGYYIDVPYRDGTLFITASIGPEMNLVPALLAILITLTLNI